jgi:hypothetical protein
LLNIKNYVNITISNFWNKNGLKKQKQKNLDYPDYLKFCDDCLELWIICCLRKRTDTIYKLVLNK